MATTRSERLRSIEKLETAFSNTQGIYLTDINRITVEQMTHLRSGFRENGVTYVVVKNSLAKVALSRIGREDLGPYFTGPVGVAFSGQDSTAAARVIRNFQKEHKELLPVKIASIEGTLFDAGQTARIADLPGREVLLSQLLSCLKAPMGNLAGVLNGFMRKFVGTLEALRAQKEQEEK